MESEAPLSKERLTLERRAQQPAKPLPGDSAAWTHLRHRVVRAERALRATRRLTALLCCGALAGVAGVIARDRPRPAMAARALPAWSSIGPQRAPAPITPRADSVESSSGRNGTIAPATGPAAGALSPRSPGIRMAQTPLPQSAGASFGGREQAPALVIPPPRGYPACSHRLHTQLHVRGTGKPARASDASHHGTPLASAAAAHRGGTGRRAVVEAASIPAPRKGSGAPRRGRSSRFWGHGQRWQVWRTSRSRPLGVYWFVDRHGHWWRAQRVWPRRSRRGREGR